MKAPDSIEAWVSALRFSRRRMSLIWDLISEREDSVWWAGASVAARSEAGMGEGVPTRRRPTRRGRGLGAHVSLSGPALGASRSYRQAVLSVLIGSLWLQLEVCGGGEGRGIQKAARRWGLRRGSFHFRRAVGAPRFSPQTCPELVVVLFAAAAWPND